MEKERASNLDQETKDESGFESEFSVEELPSFDLALLQGHGAEPMGG